MTKGVTPFALTVFWRQYCGYILWQTSSS